MHSFQFKIVRFYSTKSKIQPLYNVLYKYFQSDVNQLSDSVGVQGIEKAIPSKEVTFEREVVMEHAIMQDGKELSFASTHESTNLVYSLNSSQNNMLGEQSDISHLSSIRSTTTEKLHQKKLISILKSADSLSLKESPTSLESNIKASNISMESSTKESKEIDGRNEAFFLKESKIEEDQCDNSLSSSPLSFFKDLSKRHQIQILATGLFLSDALYIRQADKIYLSELLNIEISYLEKILYDARVEARHFMSLKDTDTFFNNPYQTQDETVLLGKDQERDRYYIYKAKKEKSSLLVHARAHLTTWLEEHDYKSPNRQQLQEIKQKTQLKNSQIYHLIHRILDSKGVINQEKKQTIKKWVQEHPQGYPSKKELEFLRLETNLGSLQIRELIRRFREDHPGVVSPETKQYIQQWIIQNNRLPNTLERKELVRMLKVNNSQLRNLLHSSLECPGSVTTEKKEFILKWLHQMRPSIFQMNPDPDLDLCATQHEEVSEVQKNQKRNTNLQSNIHPSARVDITSQEIQYLKKVTELSSKQIRYLISKIIEVKVPFTDEKKKAISDYIQELGRYPLRTERLEIERRTGLAPSQIRDYLKRIKIAPGEITIEAKNILQKWLEEHEYRKPTFQEKKDLLQCTGLNLTQLNSQIRNMIDHPNRITSSQKQVVLHWLETFQTIPSTAEEKKQIMNLTKLGSKQLKWIIQQFITQKRGRKS